jgi:hypothetical protein
MAPTAEAWRAEAFEAEARIVAREDQQNLLFVPKRL